jgi:hypothetical protein
MTDVISQMLASNKAEALQWLRESSETSFRNLGEMETTEESIEYVQHLYDLGAVTVIACKIAEYEEGQNSGHLLVQLPPDEAKRAKLFAAEHEQAEAMGFGGVEDTGQEYLFLMLD